jgi:hypothetical protein
MITTVMPKNENERIQMDVITATILLGGVALASVGVSVLLGATPGERRTYVFETADGDRDNPFATGAVDGDRDDAPAAAADARCRCCHTDLPVASYRYCRFCVAAD